MPPPFRWFDALPCACFGTLYRLTVSRTLSLTHDSALYLSRIAILTPLALPNHLWFEPATTAAVEAAWLLSPGSDAQLVVEAVNAVCGAIAMQACHVLCLWRLGLSRTMSALSRAQVSPMVSGTTALRLRTIWRRWPCVCGRSSPSPHKDFWIPAVCLTPILATGALQHARGYVPAAPFAALAATMLFVTGFGAIRRASDPRNDFYTVYLRSTQMLSAEDVLVVGDAWPVRTHVRLHSHATPVYLVADRFARDVRRNICGLGAPLGRSDEMPLREVTCFRF